jgi:hypothetical protein
MEAPLSLISRMSQLFLRRIMAWNIRSSAGRLIRPANVFYNNPAGHLEREKKQKVSVSRPLDLHRALLL